MTTRSTLIARRGLRAAGLFVSGSVALLLAARPWTAAPAEPVAPAPAAALTQPYRPAALRLALPTGLPAAAKAAPVPADTSARGMAGIFADLRRRSYFLAPAAAAPMARVAGNAAQRLTAHLAPAGYALAAAVPLPARPAPGVAPASGARPAKPAWTVDLALRGIGRGGRLTRRPAAWPTVAAATDTSVRYQHGAAFAVEYLNTPAGVRQNYYLAERPAGRPGPVQVQLTLTTALRAIAQADGQALTFAPAGGGAAVLRYDQLKAWDATGRMLPTRLRLRGATALALEVDDAGATYPLTIDPLASTPSATLLNPNATNTFDAFGISVAGAGDVNGDGYADIIVGAYRAATATNAAATGNGRAYLYLGSAAGLSTTPGATLLDPNTTTTEDFFGNSVAGAGDVNGDGYADVIVGAYNASTVTNAVGTGNGRAYLYLGSAAGLSTTPGATLNDPNTTSTEDFFGWSVAGVGDVNGDGYADVLVGAYQAATATNAAATGNGRAYLYLGSAAGLNTTPGATLLDPNMTYTEDFFGYSVAGAGDVNGDGYADIIVGAYRAAITTNAAATSNGRAYLYLGSATGLSTTASATLLDPNTRSTFDSFGFSVAGAGDVNGDGYADIIIGAYNASTVTNAAANGNGRAYLYLGSATGLSTTASATLTHANTTNTADNFGNSVAGAGDVNGDGYADVIVGAFRAATATNAGSTGNGRSYIYLGSAAGLSTTASATLLDPNTTTTPDIFGQSVAGAGDVNGDGYADIIVGAHRASTTTNAAANGNGRSYLYLGSTDALLTTPTAFRADPNTISTDDFFGYSVAGAGDVNGDGYADVIIGAYGAAAMTNAAATGNGRAYLYLGSAAGLSNTPGVTLTDPNTVSTKDYFGYSVAGAGDVNGDGYADVIIGAYGAATTTNAAANDNGRAYLYLGSATGLTNTASVMLTDPNTVSTDDQFGYSVAGAGDVNGDGYADIIVGAVNASTMTNMRSTGNGRVYIYLGSAAGLVNAPASTLTDPNTRSTFDQFGYSVAGAGDVNGDGYADVIVGAYQAATTTNAGATGNGRAYLYLGSVAGFSNTPAATLTDPNTRSTGDFFGYSVAGVGDVNSDGYADIIVGARGASTVTNAGANNNGRAYLYLGSAAGLTNTASVTLTDPNTTSTFDAFGNSVAGAGDVNGDGYADVIIGAFGASITNNGFGTGNGRAYLYLGSGTGLTNTPSVTLIDPNTTSTADLFGASVAGAGDVNGDGYADIIVGASEASTLPNAPATGNGRAYLYLGNLGAARPGGRLRVYNTDLTTPLTPANLPATQFGIGLTTRAVQGRVKARLVWEVAGNGRSFLLGSSVTNSVQYSGRGPWTDVPVGGTELKQLVRKAGYTTKVRARLEYATASPLAPTTPTNGTGGVGGAARYGPWQYVVDQQLTQLSALPLPVEQPAAIAAPGAPALRLYPNPAAGAATLTGAQPGATVQVFDALGRPVLSTKADAAGKAKLTLPAGLPAGVYLVRAGERAVRLVRE